MQIEKSSLGSCLGIQFGYYEDDGVKSHTIGWQLRDWVNQRSLDEIKRFFEENENAEVH